MVVAYVHFSLFFSGDTFCAVNSEISVSYFGQPCEFIIEDIIGANSSSLGATSDKSVAGVTDEFSELSLSKPTNSLGIIQPDSGQATRFYSVLDTTRISIKTMQSEATETLQESIKKITYDQVGGLLKQKTIIHEMIDLHLHKSDTMNKHGE